MQQDASKPAVSLRTKIFLIALAALAVLLYQALNPFTKTIAYTQISIEHLTSAQRKNVVQAIQALNQHVLKPGETFSFNQVVGPRNDKRGYHTARSYLGSDSPNTPGGGICVVSSLLYQLALESNLKILERKAHLRPVQSVSLGQDATVWYGQADLKFQNTQPFPIQVKAELADQKMMMAFKGKPNQQYQPLEVVSKTELSIPHRIQVAVYTTQPGSQWQWVSRDVYQY